MATNSKHKDMLDTELYPEHFNGSSEVDEPVAKKKSGLGWLGLTSLLFMAVLAAAYYLYQQEFKPVKDNVDKIRAQLSGEKLQKVQTALDTQADAIAGIKELQGTQNNLLQQNVIKINTLDEHQAQLLISNSDIRSLLQAANDRLRLLGDVRAAKRILTEIGLRLTSESVAPAGLVEAVQADLKRLSAYKTLDVNQVLFALNTLVNSLHVPPDVERATNKAQETPENVATDQSDNGTGVWPQFMDAISGQIKIVKYDQKLNASNAMTINQYKLDLLKLRVEALRLILWRENLQIFRNELQLTSGWINDNLDSAQVSKLQIELDKLMQLEFPEIPALKSIALQSALNVNMPTDQVQVDQPEAESFEQVDSKQQAQDSDNSGLPDMTPEPHVQGYEE